jgi:hypothetical protein
LERVGAGLRVRTLAAPHDDRFVVGDEDQTLCGWQRALPGLDSGQLVVLLAATGRTVVASR